MSRELAILTRGHLPTTGGNLASERDGDTRSSWSGPFSWEGIRVNDRQPLHPGRRGEIQATRSYLRADRLIQSRRSGTLRPSALELDALHHMGN
jgi:hypothetical protein